MKMPLIGGDTTRPMLFTLQLRIIENWCVLRVEGEEKRMPRTKDSGKKQCGDIRVWLKAISYTEKWTNSKWRDTDRLIAYNIILLIRWGNSRIKADLNTSVWLLNYFASPKFGICVMGIIVLNICFAALFCSEYIFVGPNAHFVHGLFYETVIVLWLFATTN